MREYEGGRVCARWGTEGLCLAPGASLFTAGTNLNAGLKRNVFTDRKREQEVKSTERALN